MRLSWIILIAILILLLGLIWIYFLPTHKSSTINSLQKDIADPYVRNWLEKFDYKNATVDRLNKNDSMLIIIKGKHKIGFLMNYHHVPPAMYLKIIKEKYPDCFIVLLDGEPNDLQTLDLPSRNLVVTTKHDKLPLNANVIYVPYYTYFLTYDLKIPPSILIKDQYWHPPVKSKFCIFAYSNCAKKFQGVVNRERFYDIMQDISEG